MKDKFFGVTLLLTAAIGAAATSQPAAAADDYPSRPIVMVVPFGAGGGTDVTARTVADELGKALKQSVVVETRPGANGAIGSGYVAHATPDGYTLLFTASSTYSLNPNLMLSLSYDQTTDFTAVGTIGRSPWMLVVPADSPFKTVDDLVKFAKANPEKLNFGYWTSSVQVTGAGFEQVAGVKFNEVPYKGAVEATTDLIAKRLDVMFTDTNGAQPNVKAGTMRVLATATAKRSSLLPDTPTLTEVGYPLLSDSMLAIFAPAKTPQPIVDRLNKEVSNIIANSANVREKLATFGMEPAAMSTKEANAFVSSELTRWGKIIQQAGIPKQ